MFNEKASSSDKLAATAEMGGKFSSGARGGGVFHFKCYDKDGNLKWEDKAHNLVVNEGLEAMNNEFFAGSGYSATWYLGLVNNSPSPSYAAGDTMASHAGWAESTDYSELVRQTCTFGAATLADPSEIDNSGSPAVFSIDNTVTIAGAFLTDDDTKGGSTGLLFSASTFTTPGARSVVNGDTLNVTYEFSLDAA
jgi:hypothetical protein